MNASESSPVDPLLRGLLYAWLVWIPIPFGSTTDFSLIPYCVPPLLLAAFCFTRTWNRARTGLPIRSRFTPAWAVLTITSLGLIVLTAFQLVPLPAGVVAALSPRAHAIWSKAAHMQQLMLETTGETATAPAGVEVPPVRARLSVTPAETRVWLFRLAAMVAAMQVAFLLVRERGHRLELTVALLVSAGGQVMYGLTEWYQSTQYGTHYVLGWYNARIFHRASGTFVNPNHFAAYLGVILPLALGLSGAAVRSGLSGRGSRSARLSRFLERGLVRFAIGLVGAVVLMAGILVSQSRSVLLAVVMSVGGMSIVHALASVTERQPPMHRSRRRKRRAILRVLATLAGLIVVIALLVRRFGAEHTIERLSGMLREQGIVAGRLIGFQAAIDVWHEFPLFGSGLGGFEHVVLMTQPLEIGQLFTHAHNDYLEILATTGAAGAALAFVGLFGGLALLIRPVLGSRPAANDEDEPAPSLRLRGEQRFFLIATAGTLIVAMLHALVDFDFHIPAIPATVAVILGAASAIGTRSSRA